MNRYKNLIVFMVLISSLQLNCAFHVAKQAGKAILAVPLVTGVAMYGQSGSISRKRFAEHESGHAVVLEGLDCGQKISRVYAGNVVGGFVVSKYDESFEINPSSKQLENCIIMGLAGDLVKYSDPEFQKHKNIIADELGLPRDIPKKIIDFYSDGSSDLMKAYKMVHILALDRLGIDRGQSDLLNNEIERTEDEILQECFGQARTFIDGQAVNIKDISEALINKNVLPWPTNQENIELTTNFINPYAVDFDASKYAVSGDEIKAIIEANSKK